MTNLSALYNFRLTKTERPQRLLIWRTLCEFFFQNLIGEDQIVLDLASGFEIERVTPRVLPYSTRSAPAKAAFLVRAYLAMPVLWRVFGKQFLCIARNPSRPS